MSCDVSLGDYDGDAPAFFNATVHKARVATKCYECGETIAVGQRYERVTGKWEGEVRAYRFCLPCSEIQNEFSENGRTFGITWEQFREEWRAGANLQACLNRLVTVAAKEKMTREWRKYKRLE